MELRVGIASLALVLFAAAVGRRPKLRARWRQFLLIGTLNAAIPFTLIAAAEIHLTASLAAILNSTTVMFAAVARSEEHTSELQSRQYLVCRLLLEKKKNKSNTYNQKPSN